MIPAESKGGGSAGSAEPLFGRHSLLGSKRVERPVAVQRLVLSHCDQSRHLVSPRSKTPESEIANLQAVAMIHAVISALELSFRSCSQHAEMQA